MVAQSQVAAKQPELTVTQVTRRVKELVEGEPELAAIWVRGEASNVRLAGSGHLYFTLKDENAELSIAYFGYGRRKRKPPNEGDALLVHGDVRVYEKRGSYQLVADDMVKGGIGELAAKYEALKQKLHDEGLFDEIHKIPLPGVPQHIGIVTGIATAALQDVLNVLRRRAPYLRVSVFPAAVQGDTAPPQIIAALQAADECPGVEAILLVRGGGSIEDLWCFNDEKLARELAEIERPVISGIGHEIDFTIADFVADVRAPTPSAAAEIVAPDAGELDGAVAERTERAIRVVSETIGDAQGELDRLFDRRLLRDVVGVLDDYGQNLDGAASRLAGIAAVESGLGADPGYDERLERMAITVSRSLEEYAHVLPRYRDDLLRAGRQSLAALSSQLKSMDSELSSMDPRAPKKLGFALVWNEKGKLVRSPGQVVSGERLRLEVKEGDIWTRRE